MIYTEDSGYNKDVGLFWGHNHLHKGVTEVLTWQNPYH
jgi:hypothetical protein